MTSLRLVHLLSFTLLLLTFVAFMARSVVASPPATIRAGYWPNWAYNYPPSAIDTTLFTHVLYAFLLPNNVTLGLDVSNSTALFLQNFTTTLHSKNPPVKTLISIAGAKRDPQFFPRMVSQSKSRNIFINSAIDVARKFGFDGLDLDWETPSSPKEMEDLGQLFQEWRHSILNEANSTGQAPLLLTAAVYFSVDFFWSTTYRKYPVASINKNLDFINVMCYDYHGSWRTSFTGAPAALYDPKSNISTSYGLSSWVWAGVLRHKLVMGLPLYGRTWKLKDPNVNGIGAPAVGVDSHGAVLTFSQVENLNKENNATVVYDMETVSVYSYAGLTWIGYDDAKSTTTKIKFARALGLRGYFFWAISYDRTSKIPKQASRAWLIDE